MLGRRVVRRSSGARGSELVTATLQQYADRGTFRGFSVRHREGGRREFRFTWLTREPVTMIFEPRTSTLVFKNLLPGIGPQSPVVGELKALLAEQVATRGPAHRRIDTRRTFVTCARRNGSVSLKFTIKGAHHRYVVRKSLNVVNQLFVRLHLTYPDYLTEHFSVSPE